MGGIMNLQRATSLQMKMPWKKIYLDIVHKCYRLIHPSEIHEYKDEYGKIQQRQNVNTLVEISS